MKPTRILTWHIFLISSLVLILARAGEIFNSLALFYLLAKLSFTDINYLTNNLSLELIDQFLSITFLILCTSLVILKRNKWKMLGKKARLPLSLIIIFASLTIYGSIAAPFSPNLQFNLSIAKNLPPASVKSLVVNTGYDDKPNNSIVDFIELKKSVMREVVDDNYFLVEGEGAGQLLTDSTGIKQNNQYSKIYFLLGTDEYGRDIFSRLIYATRLSVFIGIGAVIVTLIFGVLLGFLAGYYSKSAGKILNNFTDMFLAFPAIFLVILFLSLYGNSLFNVIFVIGFASWMSLFKIVRGEVISIKSKNFIITSQQLGMNKLAILRKEIIPFLMPSITVNVIFQFANIIIAESSLSFLGLTGNHVYPTLGQMVQEGQSYIKQAWWILFLANKAARKLQLKFSGHKFFN